MSGLTINTNALSLVLQNNLSKTTRALTSSMEKLSTGKKINSASDGAAELSISTKLSSQISGTAVAKENVQQGILMLNQSDSSLQSINDSLIKIRDLAVQAASGTYSQQERAAMAAEAQGYVDQINNIAKSTSFNGLVMLDGSISELKLQAGASSNETIDISNAFVDSRGTALGITPAKITDAFSSAQKANAFIADVDNAISTTSSHLSTVGAMSNSLNSVIDSLAVKQTNLEASRSQIMDVDYAKEISNYVKLQILQEADISLLSQANMQPSLVLSLL